MTKIQMLDQELHQHTRVHTGYASEFGDDQMWLPTFAAELRTLQGHYPVLFSKNPGRDDFSIAALLGFEQGENLFLKNGHWDCTYIPMMARRGPFSIGIHGEQEQAQKIVNINEASPRVNTQAGELLFNELRSPTAYLQYVMNLLDTLDKWQQPNQVFIEKLQQYELLEPVSLDITLGNGTKGQLMGFHIIAEAKLNALPAAAIDDLHKSGCLEPIYMALASLSNMAGLIERKTAKVLAQ